MTRKQFLKALNLTEDEFRDLVQKYAEFEKLLNPAQLDAVRRSMPTISQARRSLGGDLTADQLNKIVKDLGGDFDPGDGGSVGSKILVFVATRKKR